MCGGVGTMNEGGVGGKLVGLVNCGTLLVSLLVIFRSTPFLAKTI